MQAYQLYTTAAELREGSHDVLPKFCTSRLPVLLFNLHYDLEAAVEAFCKRKRKPVTQQALLATTDRKIGNLVFRLYGLAEEEIKIVEGA